MVLNALDEVLFFCDIDLLKKFISDNMLKYYPHDKESFYKEKDKFMQLHIPSKDEYICRLENYVKNGSAVWISGRNSLCDDIDKLSLIRAIDVNSKSENGREKARRASAWQNTDFWKYYSDKVLYKGSNFVLELTIGAGGGTNAVMKNMGETDYYIGADISFICAKNADAMAKYYNVNGLGISTSLWNLPFDDSVFTSICCNAGLEECREIPTILSEAVRVLEPKGRIVIRCISSEKNIWYSYFEKYGFTVSETREWLRKIRLYSDVDQVKELLKLLGLNEIEQKDDERLGSIIVFEK